MSIILKPPIAPREAFMLALMSAVACCRALRDCTHLPVFIKWPNDIVCRGKKLGGILIETKPEAGRIRHAIVGIGLNINTEEGEFIDDLKETATSIRIETGKTWKRNDISFHVISALDRWYRSLRDTGAADIRAEWLRLASTIGRAVRITREGTEIEGVAVDIDGAGSLVLKTPDGSLTTVVAGDLTYLPAEEQTG